MDGKSEGVYEHPGEEQEGEGYVPNYMCIKKETPAEEVCESETTSCPDARTTTGNILERMIADPRCRRPPCLGKWPVYPPKSESDLEENIHQFRAAQQPTTLRQMCSLRITSEPNKFRQPVIVGTLGPSSLDVSSILEYMEAGMNVARVNMAHTDPCFPTDPFRNIIEASNQYRTMIDFEVPITVMMDLKGPEIRTGKINVSRDNPKSKEVFIKQGTTIRLTSDVVFKDRSNDKIIYMDYKGLLNQLDNGMIIYIGDGEIKLTVDILEKVSIVCFVETGGILKDNQKVHIPMLPAVIPTISDYDVECLKMALQMDVDVVVVPKTRNSEMVKEVKKLLDDLQEEHGIMVFAKISNYEGLENIDCILREADGIIIHKNDLCLEISPEKMFIAQKEIIGKCNRVGKPVLCTAQLTSSKSTTCVSQRMEMSDIGGAIVDGADGIILIRETALGDQGVHAIIQLSNITREAEAATMQRPFYSDLVEEQNPSIEPSRAIALAAVQIANKIQASAILTVTTSGKTAQMLSWFRPRRPVIAISRVGKTARQMNLWRAVIPLHFSGHVLSDWFHDVKARFEYGIAYGKECGIITPGDLLVLVSGYRKKSGFTNCIRVVFASSDKNAFLDNVTHYYTGENDNTSNI